MLQLCGLAKPGSGFLRSKYWVKKEEPVLLSHSRQQTYSGQSRGRRSGGACHGLKFTDLGWILITELNHFMTKSDWRGTFPGGPVVKNLPSNVGEVGAIPGWETAPTCQGATKSERYN